MVFINVVGKVLWKDSNTIDSSQFIYSGTEVLKSQQRAGSHGASKVIIIVVLLLLILLSIGSLIIYRRYNKIKKRLNFEMQDVRNVASLEMNETVAEVTVQGDKSGTSKKVMYQGFLEEGV